jgi:hypothetical protein
MRKLSDLPKTVSKFKDITDEKIIQNELYAVAAQAMMFKDTLMRNGLYRTAHKML